jgi:molybdopterin-guanine dinucleotide biosynthesis protein A
MSPGLLPVHGFVLAGGRSSRMGQDKALLPFRGRPMVEIAVEKLRSFCAEVSIAGNRDDLSSIAPVAHEPRIDIGPGAGIEAGLLACQQPWALVLPVDVPLVPVELLRNWTVATLEQGEAGALVSFLIVGRDRQPAFSTWQRSCLPAVAASLDAGERRLNGLLDSIGDLDSGWLWPANASQFAPGATSVQMEFWFSNVNTPQELADAEGWAEAAEAQNLFPATSVYTL